MTSPPWAEALAHATGSRPASATPVAGGDIANSFLVELDDRRRIFVKHYARLEAAPEGTPPIAVAEARGLTWLAEADAIRVARPVANGDDWLALEWIDSAPKASDHDEVLGHGLARLHASAPPAFGFEAPNWIGRLPQPNDPEEDWAHFYGERRLRPLARRARDAGALPAELSGRIDRLIERLPERVAGDEPPARLHGDLWSGNAITDERGAPCLIDPAVYGGAREVDLAMMRLFGGFGERTFLAYEEAHPLLPGAEARVALYQAYPLLVHVCLFGGSYVGSLSRAVDDALG